MKLREYRVSIGHRASSAQSADGKPEEKQFLEGDLIYGTPNRDNTLIKTQEGFILRGDRVKPTGKEVDLKNKLNSEYQKMIDKIKNQDLIKDVTKKSSASINGAVIGAVSGIVLSWFTKKPMLPYFFIGTVVGGLAGNVIGKKTS